MEREMAFHIDSLARDYARDGLSDVDAQRAARRQFGNLTLLKERGHDACTMRLVEDVTRDVRHGARGLWRSPGFSLAVILTLALGIGGNTAVFSVVDQLLLRPLPYPNGDQLVMVEESVGSRNAHADVSPANWLDWQRESRTFRQFAAWQSRSFTLTGAGDPRRVSAQLVSSEFFPLLGVAPSLGRTISGEDDRPNGPRVAVLSYRIWQDQLGGDRRAIAQRPAPSDARIAISRWREADRAKSMLATLKQAIASSTPTPAKSTSTDVRTWPVSTSRRGVTVTLVFLLNVYVTRPVGIGCD